MEFSKAFDIINHNLLLAKLKAYGFSKDALTLMCTHLKNRKQSQQQQIVDNNNANKSQIVIAGAPQGSTDGPLLFKVGLSPSKKNLFYLL